MSVENQTLENSTEGNGFKQDFLASIVVFLVALPLCMGVAIASGVPVAAGLIAGIVGGIVVGTLAGCPLQVSGPAAGLTVIVYQIVETYGFEILGLVVLLGGILQLVAGVLKLGQWFRAVSPAVIKGMLAGIGVLIFASQFHVMVDDKPKGSGLTNLITIPEAMEKGMTWPEFRSVETRKTRTLALREIGELHREQAAIEERIAERLPDHASAEELAMETSEDVQMETAAIQDLLPLQKELTKKVETAIRALVEFEQNVSKGTQSQRILDACSPVVAASQTAVKEIEEGHVRTALQAQHEAVLTLDQVTKSLKNHSIAAQIGILTILLIVLWQLFAPHKLQFLPAPLIAIVVVAGAATMFSLPVLYVEVPNSLLDEIHFPSIAMLKDAPWAAVIKSAIVIAIVASAETLLCATALDQMHQGARTRYDKELTAQGVGNMICGLLGALPVTGVIVRSTANLQSGAKTRLSAVLHGVWLLIFVVFLAFILRLIPTSALAAILVYTGYKLMNLKAIKELKEFGWGEVFIFAATVITIVVADLLTGVLVGVALAAVKLLHTFSHLEADLNVDKDSNQATLGLHGAATFVRLPRLATELEKVPPRAELHVDFQHLDYIDHACLELLMSWAKQHEAMGGKLVIDWESLHARFSDDLARRNSSNTENVQIASKTDSDEVSV